MTTVRAPGSSANLGPGFDVFAVAIDRFATASDDGPIGDGSPEPCAEDHLAAIAHGHAGGTGYIWFDFDLRPGRGMGFSGAARAAGAMLARVAAGDDREAARRRAFDVVAELEGHGDNAAASVFGGVVLAHDGRVRRLARSLPGQLMLWVPRTTTATDESRASLDGTIGLDVARFTVGQVALLTTAIIRQDLELLAAACADQLHQPARLRALPASADALAVAGALGATWLSGSGPSVAAVVEPDRVGELRAAWEPTGEVAVVSVDDVGTVAMRR